MGNERYGRVTAPDCGRAGVDSGRPGRPSAPTSRPHARSPALDEGGTGIRRVLPGGELPSMGIPWRRRGRRRRTRRGGGEEGEEEEGDEEEEDEEEEECYINRAGLGKMAAPPPRPARAVRGRCCPGSPQRLETASRGSSSVQPTAASWGGPTGYYLTISGYYLTIWCTVQLRLRFG
jgi:hypothetical protein